MRRTLTAVAAAATVAIATAATPSTADARWGWWGPALGGLAVGAIIGGALASPYTADITRHTRTIPRTAIRPTATATPQPITAMPTRLGPLTAGATGTGIAIACAERRVVARVTRRARSRARRPFFGCKRLSSRRRTDQIPTN